MPVKSIVDDYLLAAMLRAKSSRAENGTLVLTVPDFPGVVACGPDARHAFDDLYRLLEDLVRIGLATGHRLPVLGTENGDIDLNTHDGRALSRYHKPAASSKREREHIYVGGPEEFEAFLKGLRKAD